MSAIQRWSFAFSVDVVSEAIMKRSSFIALLQVVMQVYSD